MRQNEVDYCYTTAEFSVLFLQQGIFFSRDTPFSAVEGPVSARASLNPPHLLTNRQQPAFFFSFRNETIPCASCEAVSTIKVFTGRPRKTIHPKAFVNRLCRTTELLQTHISSPLRTSDGSGASGPWECCHQGGHRVGARNGTGRRPGHRA